jgi:uncharacterized ferritin-like protein (DUF455 family)
MPRRKRPGDPEGAAALLHALAQIELAAVEIDVAQLALYPLAPAQWHADMASIILDECQHFDLLCEVLESWDTPFGFWPVHHTLWDGFLAGKTWLEHLVLTTRFQEASGVDASHELIAIARSVRSGRRLPQILELLEQLHEDEIRHVAIGSKWWNFALDHNAVWPSLAERDAAACEHYFAVVESRVRNPWSRRFPFYLEGRARAGFNPFELAAFGSLQPTANPRPPLEQTAKGSV